MPLAPLDRNETPTIIIQPRASLARLGIPDVWEHRHLLKYFVLRALRGRYRPTALGYGWIIARPLLLCVVYVVIFGLLFHVNTEPIPFPLFVYLGVVIFLFFSGGVMDTAAVLINNAGIMSKVYYPRLISPLSTLLVNFLDLVAALAVATILMVIYRVPIGWQILWSPLFLLGIALFTLALGLVLASRTVKSRDVMMAMPVLMRVLIYTMPCVYPVTLIPDKYLILYYCNPLSAYLQGFRWALWNEVAPPLWSVALASAVSLLLLWYGLVAFNRVERTMVDTL